MVKYPVLEFQDIIFHTRHIRQLTVPIVKIYPQYNDMRVITKLFQDYGALHAPQWHLDAR